MEYKGTTAGWKNSFAYEKLIQLLIQQIIEPTEAFVMGGSWRIPVMEKLLKKSFIEELKMDVEIHGKQHYSNNTSFGYNLDKTRERDRRRAVE